MKEIDLKTAQMLNYLHRGGSWAYYFSLPERRSLWYPTPLQPAIPQDVDVFFSVNPCGLRKGDFERAKATDIVAINCLYSDHDFKAGANLNELDNLPIAPSVVVLSGGGYHSYWFLNEPTIVTDHNRSELARIQRSWVHLVGGDPSAKDLARVLRLPGSFNHKYVPARPVKFDYANFNEVYTLDQLVSFLPAEKEITNSTELHNITPRQDNGKYWLERALSVARPGNRNNTGFWLATQLRDEGRPLNEAESIMRVFQETVTTDIDPYTLDEALATCKSAYSAEPREPAQRCRNIGTEDYRLATPNSSITDYPIQRIQALQTVIPGARITLKSHAPLHKNNIVSLDSMQKNLVQERVVGNLECVEPEIISFTSGLELSDLGNAERLVALHGADMHFVQETGKWFISDDTRWIKDTTGEAERRAQATVKSIYQEAYNEQDLQKQKRLLAWAISSQSRSRLDNMLELAKSQKGIIVPITSFDRDPFLLNFINGTLNLRNGKLQPHNPLDLITKQVQMNYEPDAICPQWMRFLDEVMDHNKQMISFLQRAIGYCLTGDTGEQVLFIAYGNGANGKSVFIETIQGMLGEDYALNTQPDTVLSQEKRGGANPDLARLCGARFVSINEIPAHGRLDEGRVKELTGGDTVTARFLFKEHFSFKPEFKLIIRTNHKPIILDVDEGIWRRMRLIPFTVSIPQEKRDPNLQNKLKEEWVGIMTWAVQGCLNWQQSGLGLPDEVVNATAEYKSEQDIMAPFIEECCLTGFDFKTEAGSLYQVYKVWSEKNGECIMTAAAFGRELRQRGFEKKHTRTGSIYKGVGLLESSS